MPDVDIDFFDRDGTLKLVQAYTCIYDQRR
jgi:hypothetical protein